ncbi:MAG: hypothetical protein ACJ75S_06790 [Solirubrobacterales bacterium]|jgi:hypothetical protein
MSNPHPRLFTTGICDTREELQRAVLALRGIPHDWTAIGKKLGISARTAKRIHEEAEAIRKEARAAAYEAAQLIDREANVVATKTGLKPATVIYTALVVVAIAVILIFFHG